MFEFKKLAVKWVLNTVARGFFKFLPFAFFLSFFVKRVHTRGIYNASLWKY